MPFFKGLKSVPLTDWKSYLRWSLIHGHVLAAPKAFVDEDFAFFEQLGHALGEAYVAHKFSSETRQRVLALTRHIEKAMEANIKTLDWMSNRTKALALEKLVSVTFKIGP